MTLLLLADKAKPEPSLSLLSVNYCKFHFLSWHIERLLLWQTGD